MSLDLPSLLSSSLQSRFDSPLRPSPTNLRSYGRQEHAVPPEARHAGRGGTSDVAEISADAYEFARQAEARGERIHTIRAQIAAGTYDTPERFDAALDKLIAAALELE